MRCKIPSADLQQKLHDTICRYNGFPVYCTVNRTTIDLYHLTDTRTPFTKIKASDPAFDISGVPLGYLQKSPTEIFYLTRFPARKTKQGLDVKYIRVRDIRGNEARKATLDLVFNQNFVDMVKGKYPPLSDSLKTLRDHYARNPKAQAQIAISRNIAMFIDEMGRINIYYKNDFVGWMQPDKNVVHVPSNDMGWVVSKYLSHELSWKID